MRSKETSIKASKLIAAPRNVGCDADVTDNEEFCKLHAKHSESLMMIHRILKLLLVFVFFGMSLVCEAGPPKFNAGAVGRTMRTIGMALNTASKYPEETKSILFYVAVAFAVLVGVSVVIMLLKYVFFGLLFGVGVVITLLMYVFLGLWEQIKLISLRLVVHLPRKWASRFKIPWLLQVKKFRRPDIWASNIPCGLLIINQILWACDASLCVFCLYSDVCFLFLLVPSLILTYYMYVGVYWVRIVIIVLLLLACIGCGMCFGPVWAGVMALVSIVMIVLLLLPQSNAWFRKQNSEVVDANVK